MLPQDQLGRLVRDHIDEQTKKFETSQTKIRCHTEELMAVRESIRLATSRANSSTAPSVEPFHYDDDAHSAQVHRNDAVNGQDDAVPLPPDMAAYSPHAEMAATIVTAINDSPVIIELRSKVEWLTNHLTTVMGALDATQSRLATCEAENLTLRMEVATLRDHFQANFDALKEERTAELQRHARSEIDFAAQQRVAAVIEEESPAISLVGQRRPHELPAKETVCDQCFGKALCTACQGCESEWYCSSQCALLRRDKHRAACEMLREMKQRTASNPLR